MPGRLDSLANVASRLVTDFGKTATLTRVTNTPNRDTGIATTTTVDETVIITPPTTPVTSTVGATMGLARATGTTVQEGDLVASVAANDVAIPDVGDRMTIDTVVYQIVGVGVTYSGEIAALYNVHLRA